MGEVTLLPCAPVKSSLEGAGSVEGNEALIVPNLWKPQMNNRIKVSKCPPLQIVIPLEILRLF